MVVNDEIQALHRRRKFFDENFPAIGQGAVRNGQILKNTCPSCGYPTLGERWSWEICTICFWEDDGQDDGEAEEVWGGPNGIYSLARYRIQTADFLVNIRTDSLGVNGLESSARQQLDNLQAIIDTYQPQDKALLLQQMRVVERAFAKLRRLI